MADPFSDEGEQAEAIWREVNGMAGSAESRIEMDLDRIRDLQDTMDNAGSQQERSRALGEAKAVVGTVGSHLEILRDQVEDMRDLSADIRDVAQGKDVDSP